MKRLFKLIIVSVLCVCLVGCGGSKSSKEIKEELDKQSVRITYAQKIKQDTTPSHLYPDMLSAIIKNDSDENIKDLVISFVAWDEHGLPVKIRPQFDYTGGDYVVDCDYTSVNIPANGSFGEDYGLRLDPECNVSSVKAIIKSYETYEGKSWSNPLYKQWEKCYKEKKLSEIK